MTEKNLLSCNTANPVLSGQSRNGNKNTYKGRWQMNTGQFSIKMKILDKKIMNFKGTWLLIIGVH